MKEQLKEMGIPYEDVIDRFMGKEDFYFRMLKKFSEDKNFEGLEQSVAQKDWPIAFKYAHTVKGICANLGLDNILEYVVPLTEELRNPPYEEEKIMKYFTDAAGAYQKTIEVIKNL